MVLVDGEVKVEVAEKLLWEKLGCGCVVHGPLGATISEASTMGDEPSKIDFELHDITALTTTRHLTQWVTQLVSARVRAMRECSTGGIMCDSD